MTWEYDLSPCSPPLIFLWLFSSCFAKANNMIITEHWCVRISMICLRDAGWKNEYDFIFTAVTTANSFCICSFFFFFCWWWNFHRNAMERFTDFLARWTISLSGILTLLTWLCVKSQPAPESSWITSFECEKYGLKHCCTRGAQRLKHQTFNSTQKKLWEKVVGVEADKISSFSSL